MVWSNRGVPIAALALIAALTIMSLIAGGGSFLLLLAFALSLSLAWFVSVKVIGLFEGQAPQQVSRDELWRWRLEANEPTIVISYRGLRHEDAADAFQQDAAIAAEFGYLPTSQTWAAGQWGCGSFLFALLLCVVLIGIVVFIYMLLVKPAGTLSVTYALHARAEHQQPAAIADAEKLCPMCAERVKAAARVCRYCGHHFEA